MGENFFEMRQIKASEITEAVEKLCINANYYLNPDIKEAFIKGEAAEENALAKNILNMLIDNADIAACDAVPICQDTGMAVVFAEVGQGVAVTGGEITAAINEGVRRGYEKGYLRKSVVKDPIRRENTKDNTPAVIHYDIVPGKTIKLHLSPKGFGSENMSGVKMLKPSDGLEGVKQFVIDTVFNAGANPCPPIIVGVGVGGTMEKAALLSKKALLRPLNVINQDSFWAGVERELLAKINELNIGPSGFGGKTTALGVSIETFPTHIAGLPVAVNISCHATRHLEVEL